MRAEFTLTRIGPERFYLISAGALETHDFDVLEKLLPADNSVRIDKVTTQRGVLVLAGPARAKCWPRSPTSTSRTKRSRGSPRGACRSRAAGLIAMRVNFVGELGYEFHHPIEMQNAIFDALMEAGAPFGIKPFGIRAMDSLRLEKSYKLIGRELSIEYAALEFGSRDGSSISTKVHFSAATRSSPGRARASRTSWSRSRSKASPTPTRAAPSR